MRVTYSDIKQFQKCPFLFSKFGDNTPSPDDQEASKEAFLSLVKSYYRLPDKENAFDKHITGKLRALLNQKLINKKKFLDIIMQIKSKVKLFLKECEDLGYVYFSGELNLPYSSHNGVYSFNVGLLLYNNISRKILPVFIFPPEDRPLRNNYFRFALVGIQKFFDCEIEEFAVASEKGFMEGALWITKYPTHQEELFRAEQELINILETMDWKIKTPNTSECPRCNFYERCNL